MVKILVGRRDSSIGPGKLRDEMDELRRYREQLPSINPGLENRLTCKRERRLALVLRREEENHR